ncbi:MAG: hypothetical protein CMJ25_02910 [Phycisphaerae bacterium]|nr:hypothetical protein [Phycisphaerae bacterium]
MYKVRFHLGRGKNFMKWQVKYLGTEYGGDDRVSYVSPQNNQLAMIGCKLSLQPTAAQKIHDGANKTVCAWIECEAVQVLDVNRLKPNEQDYRIKFNPHQSPNWTDGYNNIISGNKYEILFTNDRTLWVVGEAYECGTSDLV